jgi:hypothetical protein
MSARTIYLSRLFGLFQLILAMAEVARRSAMVESAAEIVNAPALLLISGMMTLAAGLAVVLGHNVWRGGAMPVIVTVLGWVLLIKGTALLVIPPAGWAGMLRASHYAEFYWGWVAIPLVLGAYLTWAGFSAREPRW